MLEEEQGKRKKSTQPLLAPRALLLLPLERAKGKERLEVLRRQMRKNDQEAFIEQSALANGLLDRIHTDVCGPLNTSTRGGFSYFIIFIDDHSRYGYVYLMRSTRESLLPERFGFIRLTSQLDNDPRTHGEVKSDIDSDNWFEAMKSEIDLMGSNLVWTIVDPPKGVKPLECKWIYKRKLGADGEVTTFKVRLVTKGYSQQPGVNFEKTYSLVAMAKSTRILLAIAAWLSSPYVYGPSVYCLPSPGLSLGYGIWCRFHPGLGVYA
ncbi:UNVERIFIED_CONTAM: hypothetical protein Scaly_2880900 [Sesamum calycinum]|uniref:Reverse transcriptase Ty1/copia-type domain-containing protein n=1 Tax=Sesamum calycinum TaxID=2727403 RepID=A0AAW2L8P7_9LAMI